LLAATWITGVCTGLRLRQLGGPNVWSGPVIKLLLLAVPGFALRFLGDSLGAGVVGFVLFGLYLAAASFAARAVAPHELHDLRQALTRR
jgi:cbb3-type cytochrome oxidase subunit 1